MNLFKSLMYLGGLESISPRIEEPEDEFGPTYGNRVASARSFGRAGNDPAPARDAKRVDPALDPAIDFDTRALGGCR